MLWQRVDERVLGWVATLPPAFSTEQIYDFPTLPPELFAPLPGLDTRDVGESLRRLADFGFIAGKIDRSGESWWDLRLAPRGLVYLGEWPDLELVASAAALHRVLRALADEAPDEQRDALVRSAGVVGRTVDAVLRDTLSEVAHAGGAEAATLWRRARSLNRIGHPALRHDRRLALSPRSGVRG